MKSYLNEVKKAKKHVKKIEDKVEEDKLTKENNVASLKKKLVEFKLKKKGLNNDDQELIDKKKLCELSL